MKTKSKALLLTLCAVLLVAASVLGTMAYLTDSDKVENTFTVGKVDISLDEAKVGADGKALTGNDAKRVQENSYKLLPGHKYDKDPTVTVKSGSEASYVKMTVTVSKSAELDKIFKDHKIADLTTVIGGYDATNWFYKGTSEDTTANTRTYEFWYKEAVSAGTTDVVLDDLFEAITVPGDLTNAEIATIADMTITVNAYAIQADGFTATEGGNTAEENAWAAFHAT